MAIMILVIFQMTASSGYTAADNPGANNPPANSANKQQDSEFKITDFKGECIKDLSKEPIAAGDFQNISFGPTVAAQVLTYDLASKKAGFNTGAGAGFSMRLYNDVKFYKPKEQGKEKAEVESSYGIKEIRKKCRAETFDAAWLQPDNQKVIPWLSISPMVYASKSANQTDFSVQPAITIGFLGELLNVGTGFNLSGPNQGHVFLLLSLGYGFKF
jgi:hypothetical protein